MSALLGPEDNLAAVVRQLASDGMPSGSSQRADRSVDLCGDRAATVGFTDWFRTQCSCALYDCLR